MRIGIDLVTCQHAGAKRGNGRFGFNLASALTTLAIARCHTIVGFCYDNLPGRWLPPTPFHHLVELKHTRRALGEHLRLSRGAAIDALLVMSPYESTVMKLDWKPLRIVSICYDLIPFLPGDYWHDRYATLWGPRWHGEWKDALVAHATHDHVCCISERTRDDFIAIAGDGVRNKTSVCYAGAADFWKPSGAARRSNEILAVTAEDARKGQDVLIRAVSPAVWDAIDRGRVGRPLLRIVNKFSDQGRRIWQGFADANGCSDRVSLEGEVPDDRLRELYQTCGVFAFPSRYEGFGLPVLEAMLCGAPVVSSSSSCLREVAGDAAKYVNVTHPSTDDPRELAAALVEVLADKAMAGSMSASSIERAADERFKWPSVAMKVLDKLEHG